jgi:type IV pilus assembly protein PilA
MISALRQRLAREEGGFTLIELLVVIIIIGILLAIAVPSYLGFRDRANRAAAQANVRAAVPAVEAYFADNSSYAGMGGDSNGDGVLNDELRAIDAGLASDLRVVTATGDSYCIEAGSNGSAFEHYYGIGPDGPATSAQVTQGSCD